MKHKRSLLIFLFFLLVTGLFFWPSFSKGWLPFPGDLVVGYYTPWNSYSYLGYLPGSVPHKAQGIDVARQLFPWKHFSVERFKQGQLPLWNPYNFSGNPHLANFQTAIFYPLNFLFFFLPFNLAWTVFILLQPLLACLFTYLFLKKLKISSYGAVLGALAFAFSLYLTVWLEWGNIGHALLWLPLILFLGEKLAEKTEFKWFLVLVFALICSILAGYIQATTYLFVFGLVYFFWKKRGFLFLLGFLLSLGLSAFQLLPTLEIFLNSARKAFPPEKISELLLPPFYLVTTFVPDFFGNPASRNYWYPGTYIERVSSVGVIPLFLAILAIFLRRKEKSVRFFTLAAFVSLFFSLNILPVRFFYSLKIPLLSTMVFTRLLSIFSFSLAVLAGFGFDLVWRRRKKKAISRLAFIFLSFYLFLWMFTFWAPTLFSQSWWVGYLKITQRNLVLPTFFAFSGVVLIQIFFQRLKFPRKIFLIGISFFILFDLYFYFQKITPFSPPKFVFPQTAVMEQLKKTAGFNRFWGYGSGYVDSNFATMARTYSTDGYDPLFIRRYGELISASDNGKIKDPLPRADVNLVRGYGKEALRENSYRQRLLNLLGVKYILHRVDGLAEEWQPDETTFPPAVYQLVWQETSWQIYENQAVLPRAFLVGEYQVETERQKIVDSIFDLQFPLDKKIILEKSLPLKIKLGDQSESKTQIISYQPNRVEIKTVSSAAGLLFLSDNFYSGWKAIVDNRPTEIYRANYTFRAVVVPEGEHRIVFYFIPDSFKKGLILALVSCGFIIIGAVIFQFKQKEK